MGPLRPPRFALVRAASWSAGLLVTLSPLLASAAIAPAIIDYRSDAACPNGPAFLDAVRAQTPNLTPPAPGARARRLSISIDAEGDALTGRLRVDELDGTSSVREVTGQSCDEIIAALAFVAALTIEDGPTPRPVPTRIPTRAPAPVPVSSPLPSRDIPRAEAFPSRTEIGARTGAFLGLAPDPSAGVEPFVDWSAWGKSGLAPALRLGVAFAASPSTATQGGTVTFLWLAARASACPFALTLGPFTGRPCAGIEAGMLHGRGAGIAHPAASTRPWIAPTLAARTQWAIATTINVEVEAGLTVPLIRDRFVFDTPAIDAHATPSLGGFVGIGIGFLLGSPAPPRFP